MSEIEQVAARYARYRQAKISELISPHDDMFVPDVEGNMAHYMSVGRSAIDIIVAALVAAGNPKITTILDLPCGGGRVTRHLKALFPDSDVYASELAKEKENFVVDVLGAKRAEPNPNFIIPPARLYDLIFVGSLLTHLDERRYRQALTWLVSALASNGLLVVTTHGRRHMYMQLNFTNYADPDLWKHAQASIDNGGLGYVDYAHIPAYGTSASNPSWVVREIEDIPSARIISLHEAAWDCHQDAVVVQKHDLTPPVTGTRHP